MTELIVALQARGEVQAHLDAGAMGQIVFNNLNQMFIEFVKDDDMTLDAFGKSSPPRPAPLPASSPPEKANETLQPAARR